MADITQEGDMTRTCTDRKKKVGNYVLGEKISEGSYSTVRIATHTIAQQKVAVKVISKDVLAERDVARRHFRRQALLSQYVRHPNMVCLHEAMETSNTYYLVLDLAERGPFSQYLAQRRCLSEVEAREFASQLVSAVEHMHVSGVVHRDIRLDNLLLDKNSCIKICGFGQGTQPVLGQGTQLQGLSPIYVAPEVFNGKSAGTAADIWSIGVCIYTMLTGKLPFISESPSTVQQIHNNVHNGCQLPETLSYSCQDVLNRLLEPSEGKRITMADLLNHPWLTERGTNPVKLFPPIMSAKPEALNLTAIRYLCEHFDFSEADMLYSVGDRKVDSASAAYHLLLKSMEEGHLLPGLTTRSDSSPSPMSSLGSGDSVNSQGHDLLPQVQTTQSRITSRMLSSLRPVKTSTMTHRDNRLRNTRINRPRSYDPQIISTVRNRKPLISRSTLDRLPEIRNVPTERSDPKYGAYGRHREAWDSTGDSVLNVRGTSPVRDGGFYVNYNSLTPQIMTFDPPVPPNTAMGMRRRAIDISYPTGRDTNRQKSIHLKALRENRLEETEQFERQKSLALFGGDSQKSVLPYSEPFASSKKLSTREQKSTTIAVFKKISEQNEARRELRWSPHLPLPRTQTSMSEESVERDDFLRPVMKVTISTCKS